MVKSQIIVENDPKKHFLNFLARDSNLSGDPNQLF